MLGHNVGGSASVLSTTLSNAAQNRSTSRGRPAAANTLSALALLQFPTPTTAEPTVGKAMVCQNLLLFMVMTVTLSVQLVKQHITCLFADNHIDKSKYNRTVIICNALYL